MPEVTAAAAAMHFIAHHAVTGIGVAFDRAGNRIVEARPAGAAFEFQLGGEQRLAARGAVKRAGALLMQKRATSRHLGAVLAHDVKLLGGEDLAPFGVAVGDGILFGHRKLLQVSRARRSTKWCTANPGSSHSMEFLTIPDRLRRPGTTAHPVT